MILFLLAYFGGVLTIVSPCILPVLPFVFARADRPFLKSGLPMLIGMAVTFAGIATLAALGGGWAVSANQTGRTIAVLLMALFGLSLLIPELADRLSRPLVALGSRLSASADEDSAAVLPSLLLGVATGLLWAPCAGPILGLILTGAALEGASLNTSLALLAYAAGAATSLALALLVGGRVFSAMKKSLGAGEWIRRGLGAAVLIAALAILAGADTGFLTRASLASTGSLEQSLLDKLHPPAGTTDSVLMSDSEGAGGPGMMMMKAKDGGAELPVEGSLPALNGAVQWLNSPPLTADALKGKVVVVDFWTYSCINCLRALPYVKEWAETYKDHGLVVIGVHAPEFAFEKDPANVKKAVADLGITYPVALDNNYAIWRGFNNHYWPAHYFIDAQGKIRHHHFGEGDYDGSEKIIRQLLTEAGQTDLPAEGMAVKAAGAQAAPDLANTQSPETYLGFERAENFASPGGAVENAPHLYATADKLGLNQWGLTGEWTISPERAVLDKKDGTIAYHFHARDLHLVLGPSGDAPVHFKVTIDGRAPGNDHGADIDADGNGTITGQRLYQLVRQAGPVADHVFEIRFSDPGAQAYAFTFG
jgi:cytochrome c biogenesis protein CcdA/thiol-disulfide isomerase/thioredoxin